METEMVQPGLPLMAGAVALGAACAMGATVLLFPVIDRFLRPRFKLERGGAMLLLLTLSLLVGVVSGTAGYFWLKDRAAAEEREETAGGYEIPVHAGSRAIEEPPHGVTANKRIANKT